ncbi:MAG TPA: 3-ketoacyl-ACP reductase FabG2 [Nevskia sp.]|nr:3-ketoacyl-ACP reductase FabG2 [Nevskia sp.]
MNRRVLVTGSSRGIGRCVALRLARAGFGVVLHGRAPSAALDAVAAELGGVPSLAFDIADRAACKAALEADLAAHGAYYGVVYNAGIARDGTFAALSGEDWDQVLHTNLDGFYNVIQPLLMPMVRQRRGGRIVTLASVSGVAGNRGQVNYSASKAGIIGATKALAVELASRNITVNCVAPGPINTDMLKDAPTEEMLKMIPAGRLGEADEVASLVAYLMGDDAAYITRQVIGVNGGMV